MERQRQLKPWFFWYINFMIPLNIIWNELHYKDVSQDILTKHFGN